MGSDVAQTVNFLSIIQAFAKIKENLNEIKQSSKSIFKVI
jgi:hypothetical protein